MERFLLKSIKRKLAFLLVLFIVVILSSFVFIVVANKDDPISSKIKREEHNTSKNIVNDVTELNPIQVQGIVVPHTREEIIEAVKSHDVVSIGGGRNSMGGQTASVHAVQIDMRQYNKILSLSTTSKEITVESGIRWRDIQDAINPYDLSVKIMQTYSNFTVGGSLSTNVHGRYIGLGPIILSVKSFRIVLADGTLVEASPFKNEDIFYTAIGGMGGIGVITDVTLSLDDNRNVERSRVLLDTKDYASYFKENIRDNKKVIFHNGDMYPVGFEKVSAVSWSITDKDVTTDSRLIPRLKDYWKERVAWVVMSEWPKGRWIRQHIIDPILYSGDAPVHTRNYEASYDIAELEPKDRDGSTYVLQEYFVPVERFDEWVPKMKKVFNDNNVNVINVSIRHALPDLGSKLAWAKTESFAFVVYYKQGTSNKDKVNVGKWTRQMIDEVLSVGGTYYLPYQLHATKEQLQKAYPQLDDYFVIKKRYDPTTKFTNALWDKYYDKEKDGLGGNATSLQKSDYGRTFAITYTALPEWYIVYSADEMARVLKDGLPSQFPFSLANYEYWRQHAIVLDLVKNDLDEVSVQDYLVVLKVIGVSFSLENSVKAVYENTVGKLSEMVANNKQTKEDKLAYRAARDYALFIYDYPWYDFPYMKYFKEVWTLSNQEGCCTLGEYIRSTERKVFLSIEFLLKSGYAAAIAYATHQKFGVQDDVVCATVSYTKEHKRELLCAPHYQPFTREMIAVLEKNKDNHYFTIYDIAGNEKIALTYREMDGVENHYEGIVELDRYKEIQSVNGSVLEYKDRVTSLVPVSQLPLLFEVLSSKGVQIDHLYDF